MSTLASPPTERVGAVAPRATTAGPSPAYWIGFAVVVAALAAAPLVLPEFWQRFVTEILIWGLLAMSSDLLIGYTGMVSFGHSAFFGLGMYGAAAALLWVPASPALAAAWGSVPKLWAAMAAGLVAAALVAVFVAYFATRLREIYFSITTLVFSQIFYVIIFTWTDVTGGENGLTFRQPPFEIPGLLAARFTRDGLHWFVLAVVAGSYLLLRRITQSPFGMVLQSIRENEARTRAIGYHVERYKIVSVMLSGIFAGLAGVLYAIQNKFAAPDFVLFLVSGETVIFNVMGGMGTLVGPVAGAACFLLMKEVFSRVFYEYYLIPVGLIFMLIVVFIPQGLLGFWRRALNR
jgi:branched-chain amino acid transport system permease protein